MLTIIIGYIFLLAAQTLLYNVTNEKHLIIIIIIIIKYFTLVTLVCTKFCLLHWQSSLY